MAWLIEENYKIITTTKISCIHLLEVNEYNWPSYTFQAL